MKIVSLALAVTALLTGVALAQSRPAEASAKPAPHPTPVPAEITWQKTCSRCHTTGVGPELRGRDLPPEYITAIVRNGFLAMPAFPHSALDDASLQAVATMVSKSKAPSGATHP